ncbi:MAG TPA: hypothetical protein DEA96_16740 [Leptospiraceae bacterium]|nr:hypothetical protein [Spirochaetaceae bacterium]HBS06619.1 hypothetical protein [Leptospiraceae bacterium]
MWRTSLPERFTESFDSLSSAAHGKLKVQPGVATEAHWSKGSRKVGCRILMKFASSPVQGTGPGLLVPYPFFFRAKA